jgi:hypothetical protein
MAVMPFTRLSRLVVVAAVAWGAVLTAQGVNDPPDTPQEAGSRRETLAMLRQSRFDALDRKMNGLQHAYEAGRLADEGLLHEFRAFYDTDPALEPQYDAWLTHYPQSYAARLARGIYLRYLGNEARGTRYVSETPRAKLDLMATYHERAARDYEESLKLTAKPLLTYHAILSVAMYEGGRELSRQVLDDSVRIDPRNFVVRYKYLMTLQTRWGGSLQDMLDFTAQARSAGLSGEQLRYFDNMIAVERRWLQKTGR